MAKSKKINPKAKARINITPLGDRVVVRPLSEEEMGSKTPSGIIIPDTIDKEKPQQGEVVAVGKGWYQDGDLIPLEVNVGDKVMFSKYGYDQVKVGGEEYFILKQDSILAVIG